MKRLIVLAVLALITVAAFAPAQADPPAKTPIVFACTGTGGWGDDPNWGTRWTTKQQEVPVGCCFTTSPCGAWSPDTARPPSMPPSLDTLTSVPVGEGGYVNLNGVGDFACGEGTLTTAPGEHSNIGYWHFPARLADWDAKWTAKFSNGVGELTGTATYDGTDATGEVRTLSGTIVVDDGTATGHCDDSAGASHVAVSLVLT